MSDSQPVSFSQLLSLKGADGSFTAQISEQWAQGRAAFGGLLAAQMARALERVVPGDRPLRSALIDFIAPAAPGPVTIQASLLRSGKSLTHGEARMLQNGALLALFIGTYGAARDSEVHVPGPAPSGHEAPTSLPHAQYVEGLHPRFTQFFEFRMAHAPLFSSAKEGKLAGYVRYTQPGLADSAGVLGLIDAWPPAVLPLLSKPAPASTVTWMVDMVGTLPPAGTESHDYYRYEATTVAAQDGYGSCEARLWGPHGGLIAASRQLVMEFSSR